VTLGGGGSSSVEITGRKKANINKPRWLFYSPSGSASSVDNGISRGAYIAAVTVRNQRLQ